MRVITKFGLRVRRSCEHCRTFNMAWQEISARDHRRMNDENANWLRSELAEAIMSAGHQDPILVEEVIMEKIRRGSFQRRLYAA